MHCESNLRGSTFLQTSCSGGSRGGWGVHPPPARLTGNTLTVVKSRYDVCRHNRHREFRKPHFWHFCYAYTSLCCLLVNTRCCPPHILDLTMPLFVLVKTYVILLMENKQQQIFRSKAFKQAQMYA